MLYKKIALLFVVFAISGCTKVGDWTVKPLHQETYEKLNPIYVATIRNEYGVYIRNALTERINTTANPKYRLEVSYKIERKNLAIGTDNSIARKQINATVNYKIVDIKGSGKVVQSFNTFGFANFSTAETAYLSEVSEKYAIRRSLLIATQEALLRLSNMFKNGILK